MTEGHISISEEDVPIIKEFFPEWYDEIDNNGIDFLSGRYTKKWGSFNMVFSYLCNSLYSYDYYFTTFRVVSNLCFYIYQFDFCYIDVADYL